MSYTRPVHGDPGNDGSATDATVIVAALSTGLEAVEAALPGKEAAGTAAAAVAAHASDTTAVHGIADTSALVLTGDARLSDARDLKTPTADVAFNGHKATGLADPTNPQDAATRAYVLTEIAANIATLVDSAPGTLDTLNELAAALADDPNFAGTITTALAGKAPTSRLVSAGSGLTGGGSLAADRTLAADFGTGAGKVTEGNDSRLSDARTPTAHAASHLDNGSDPVAVFTSSRSGAVPASGGGTTNFLRADGTFAAPGGGGSASAAYGNLTTARGDGLFTAPNGPMVNGNYDGGGGALITGGLALADGDIFFEPFLAWNTDAATRYVTQFAVQSISASGSPVVRFGLYTDSSGLAMPQGPANLVSLSEVASAGFTGAQIRTSTLGSGSRPDLTNTPTWFWRAVCRQGGSALTVMAKQSPPPVSGPFSDGLLISLGAVPIIRGGAVGSGTALPASASSFVLEASLTPVVRLRFGSTA